MNGGFLTERLALADEARVVLVDEQNNRLGTMLKSLVHTESTSLHRAFSCYVLDAQGRLLVTRRALAKSTWPGVWTNSFCGHPLPEEAPEQALRRRAEEELGLELSGIELILPDFRYRAVDASGIVEHEICPVFSARTVQEPVPEPSEVMDWAWTSWAEWQRICEVSPWLVSPWAAWQMSDLSRDKNHDENIAVRSSG